MPIENRKSKIENPWRAVLAVTLLAIALSYVFWRPLWHGGGLVGGDTYSYYFPQKTFLADELHAGRLPLWNSLVGHGYPTVGESQTGVFYPPHLLLYALLPANTAYNATQILHYLLAFVATWLFARRLGLAGWGATLCAIVYVYGWFAPRICLEWAILGAPYLPLLGWCAESYLQTRHARFLGIMSLALGVHLLAGHFNLAFIEVLAVIAYVALRLLVAQRQPPPLPGEPRGVHTEPQSGERAGVRGPRSGDVPSTSRATDHSRSDGLTANSEASPPERLGGSLALPMVAIVLSLIAGFGLAAMQLAPTWELKTRSQRADVGRTHDPGYGHIPPWYLVQVVTPWMWYAPDVNADEALASMTALSYPASTNKVEAHLYFGLIPLLLAFGGLWKRRRTGARLPAPLQAWLWIGLFGVVYATGWLLLITRHLPGFSFFIGPGRYGILTTLAISLLAGDAFDRWLLPPSPPGRGTGGEGRARGTSPVPRAIIITVVLGLTVLDLWNVRCHWNRRVDGAPNWYADLVPDPPINHRDESEVRALLAQYPQPVRIWGTYQNMPTITGYAMTPTYLGLSPAEYADPQLTIPKPAGASPTQVEIDAQVAWLRRAGVTHLLSEQRLDTSKWPIDPVWTGHDGLLHRAWGRQEPLYLYTLNGRHGHARIEPVHAGTATVTRYQPERIAIDVNADADATLILTDLAYPGWTVNVDGQPAEWTMSDGMYRSVPVPAGQHSVEWTYAPRSIRTGLIVSILTAVLLVVGLWFVRRQSRRLGYRQPISDNR